MALLVAQRATNLIVGGL